MSKPQEEGIEGLNSNVEQAPEIPGLGERGFGGQDSMVRSWRGRGAWTPGSEEGVTGAQSLNLTKVGLL